MASSTNQGASLRAHRGALALNNMAIHLMERGHCGRALKTLRDSLSLLHVALLPAKAETPSADDSSSTVHDFSSRVFQVASQRYVASWRERDASNELICEIKTVDEDDFHALRAAAKYGPSASLLFPVRISESCTSETRDFSEITRQLGIIEYNHGVANFLLALQRAERKSGKFLEQALKSLVKADKVFTALTEHDNSNEEEGGRNTAATEHSWFLFSAIALNCLSIVYHSKDSRGKAEEAEKAGSFLCTKMEENYIIDILTQRQTCAAAA